MNRHIAWVIAALIMAAGCGSPIRTPVVRQGNSIDYHMTIHQFWGLFTCSEVEFSRVVIKNVHRGDHVNFVIDNHCGSDQSLSLEDQTVLFDGGQSHPTTIPAGRTVTLSLTVSTAAADDQPQPNPTTFHKSNIRFRGKNHDPGFEIDP